MQPEIIKTASAVSPYRVIFASANHLPHVGGNEITTDQLARRLTARGHALAILTGVFPWSGRRSLPERVLRRLLKLVRRDAPLIDNRFPYKVYRALDPARSFGIVRDHFRPDVLIINAGVESFSYPMIHAAGTVPTIVYLHGGKALQLLQRSDFRANLTLTVAPHLKLAAAELGYDAAVIPPLIDTDVYTPHSNRRVVLFVNPIPQKGVETAWGLAAARPDIPFIFLESWQLDSRTLAQLRNRSRLHTNVQIRRAVSDPSRVYAEARILLAPYPANEGSPRVIAEAQTQGIPVIATDVPSLRFAAGDGAVFVKDGAPISDWVAALGQLWDDEKRYERSAEAARRYATRPDVLPAHIIQQFEQAIAAAIAAKHLELVRLPSIVGR